MKNSLLTIFITSIHFIATAQKSDSTHTHYAFYRGFSTHETELKSKRGILNGEYKILNGNFIAAIGLYKNDERVGRWQFFLQKDSLDQIYNYTTKTVEFNRPDKRLTVYIDSLKDGDKVKYPVKITGNLGLFLLMSNYKVPYEMQRTVGEYKVYHNFTLNKEGKLIKFEIQTASANHNKVQVIDLKKLRPEDLEFSPAKRNGENTDCVMVLEARLTTNFNR